MLKIGESAPDFSLKNQDGVEVRLSDFSNKCVVLYFYPKDNTPGCTTQAIEFSSLLSDFMARDCIIVGVSPDAPRSHQNFIQRNNLNILLLSDPDKYVASLYGAYGPKKMYGREVMGIIRSTFIIRDGVIKNLFYNVRAKGHARDVLNLINQMGA